MKRTTSLHQAEVGNKIAIFRFNKFYELDVIHKIRNDVIVTKQNRKFFISTGWCTVQSSEYDMCYAELITEEEAEGLLLKSNILNRLTENEKNELKRIYKSHVEVTENIAMHCAIRNSMEEFFGKDLFRGI